MAEERKYRIRVDGILVDVSKEVYRAYYSIERHTRTLDEKDIRNGKVLYSDLDTDELLGEDMIPDMTSERVEDSAIYSILREKLHQYLGMLPPQDMELIQALYFECMTEREYAQQIGISQKGVNLLRSQKFLCKCRMCGARIGPDDNKPCCGGSPSHRKNYLPGGHPIPKILWYLGTGTALRGSAEGGRGQCQTQAGGSRTAAYWFVLERPGSTARLFSGTGLHCCSTPDGALY